MEYLVHPVADLFPMLAEDELRDLAEDIKQRGLLHPIVLDADGLVLDGRNRLAACRIAGVEPEFVTFDGDDPNGYALAVNVQRRNLGKGQIAMIAAMAQRDSSSGTIPEGLTIQADLASEHEVSRTLVAKAAIVLRFAPELAGAVVAGGSLNEAYATASQRKREAEELARQHATRVSDTFRRIVGRILTTYHTEELRGDVLKNYADSLGEAMPAEVNADTIRLAGDYLHAIADQWKGGRRA